MSVFRRFRNTGVTKQKVSLADAVKWHLNKFAIQPGRTHFTLLLAVSVRTYTSIEKFFFQMHKTFNNNVHIFVNSSQIDTTYSELFKYVFVVPRTFHLSCIQQTLSEKDPSKKMLQPVVGYTVKLD
jgi:hypothetical protein